MDTKTIQEGLVTVKAPQFDKVSSKAPVFYNPVMELNRDLSVVAIKTFQENIKHKISICDSFGGTGIRGIRYAKEIPNVSYVVINDINPLAIQFTKENTAANNLNNIRVYKEDANILLRKCGGKFDVIDIDPFGTPSYYVESAAASIKSSGMLCATATDTSALCGTYKEPCIRKYGAMPLKTEYCHEIGIRILAGFITRTFAKYKKKINVKFSHSSEHYMRLYITVEKGAKITDESMKDLGYILHCEKCLYRTIIKGISPKIPSKCPECGENSKVAGPLWCGDILNLEFIEKMLKNAEQMKINKEKHVFKLLNMCYEEATAPATFYDLHRICKNLKISAPSIESVLNKLREENYFASRTHFKPTGFKTDAPLDIVKKIVLDLAEN